MIQNNILDEKNAVQAYVLKFYGIAISSSTLVNDDTDIP